MSTRDVYIIRHASLDPHEEDRIGGNPPLSAKGHKEALELGKRLKNAGIDVLYYSDMIRAHQTADELDKTLDVPCYSSKLFRSWNLGDMAGRLYTECQTKIEHLMTNASKDAPKGGESFSDFIGRIRRGVREVLAGSRDKGIGIITHYRVERLIAAGGLYGKPDHDVMISEGEDPAHAEKVAVDLARLVGAKGELEGKGVTGPKKVDWNG